MVTNNKSNEANQGYWYFISFRDVKMNRNLGCCNVRTDLEDCPRSALEKVAELGICPVAPSGKIDYAIFPLDEPELEPNRLYSREEMQALEYEKIDD